MSKSLFFNKPISNVSLNQSIILCNSIHSISLSMVVIQKQRLYLNGSSCGRWDLTLRKMICRNLHKRAWHPPSACDPYEIPDYLDVQTLCCKNCIQMVFCQSQLKLVGEISEIELTLWIFNGLKTKVYTMYWSNKRACTVIWIMSYIFARVSFTMAINRINDWLKWYLLHQNLSLNMNHKRSFTTNRVGTTQNT